MILMETLRERIEKAESSKTAIGHFNISDMVGFWAVVNAGKKLGLPVIIGVSEGERDFIGIKQVKALVESVRKEGLPVFLNADHTYSVQRVLDVADVGFDSAIIDCADKPFDENVRITKEAVSGAKQKSPGMLIESELGFIGKSSMILDEIPAGAEFSEENMTKPEEAAQFVKETGIDLFAPAVGNIHGMVKGGNPKLNIERIRAIREAAGVPLVLHGGSGIPDDEFKQAIAAGISVVHINTELRLAYRQSLQKFLSENQDEIAPYKIFRPALQEMQSVVEKRMALFANL